MKKIIRPLAELAEKVPAALPDSLMVSGASAVSYGAWLIYPAAGFITGGVLLLVGGTLAAMTAARRKANS